MAKKSNGNTTMGSPAQSPKGSKEDASKKVNKKVDILPSLLKHQESFGREVSEVSIGSKLSTSTPGTPNTKGSNSFGPRSSIRRGGSRPGEFVMPSCRFSDGGKSKLGGSLLSFPKVPVIIVMAIFFVAFYYLEESLKQSKEFEQLVDTYVPAVEGLTYTHVRLALCGVCYLLVCFVIKISTSGDKRGVRRVPSGKAKRAADFESDDNTNSQFAMPKIKKAKDPAIVALRATEYSRLDRDNQCYLDYTGGMLYPESLIRRHMDLLLRGTYGNPHSSNPTSFASTALCDKARADVLKFFNADPEEYLCIFTSNASGALRIVGESFPFVENSQYLLLMDNHNSVNGIREFAISRGATVTYARTNTSLRIDDDVLEKLLEKNTEGETTPSLFAYPAQSNFSGVKHSLEWVDRAQQLGWYVLLDAAAFVPSSPLDLSAVKPDFVSMSFYKIFGYPTGVGALLMRKRCVPMMQRPWFAGGTIKFVTCSDASKPNSASEVTPTPHGKKGNGSFASNASSEGSNHGPRDPMHVLAHDHEAFEDGTINYLSLAALSYGIEFMTSLDMTKVSGHVQALTSDLIDSLSGLVHSNGQTVINILGPNSSYKRGGTVSINVVDVNGTIIPPMVVEKLANEQMISIRSGCFCNPGDSEILFPEAWRAMMELLDEGDPLKAREMGLGIAAAIRISVGIPTSDSDITRVIKFLASFKNTTKDQFEHLMVCPMAAH
eukprot:GILI01003282.1.p1 GENE.GILI01003282.1~~GILI01003282.1.p1  ORF type:complete len:719 (+),score=162.40 GILI01003282.1:129-2285(+)